MRAVFTSIVLTGVLTACLTRPSSYDAQSNRISGPDAEVDDELRFTSVGYLRAPNQKDNPGVFSCSAGFIKLSQQDDASRAIVTSAHCKKNNLVSFQNKDSSWWEQQSIQRIVHPNFLNPGYSAINDIAVITTADLPNSVAAVISSPRRDQTKGISVGFAAPYPISNTTRRDRRYVPSILEVPPEAEILQRLFFLTKANSENTTKPGDSGGLLLDTTGTEAWGITQNERSAIQLDRNVDFLNKTVQNRDYCQNLNNTFCTQATICQWNKQSTACEIKTKKAQASIKAWKLCLEAPSESKCEEWAPCVWAGYRCAPNPTLETLSFDFSNCEVNPEQPPGQELTCQKTEDSWSEQAESIFNRLDHALEVIILNNIQPDFYSPPNGIELLRMFQETTALVTRHARNIDRQKACEYHHAAKDLWQKHNEYEPWSPVGEDINAMLIALQGACFKE